MVYDTSVGCTTIFDGVKSKIVSVYFSCSHIKVSFSYAGNNEAAAPPPSGTDQHPCQPQEQNVPHRGKSRYS